jgi:signal transduction histidine kinase
MRDRIDSVGGRFTVQSVPGGGTTVRANVPVRQIPTPREG